ncbi:MAG: hypothetical protein DHS20C08_06740 [Rhodomicrobium sp.]|nr:MAG: hypothetical protein DHS20C08_06740 [Rhodomicrobium sp.]
MKLWMVQFSVSMLAAFFLFSAPVKAFSHHGAEIKRSYVHMTSEHSAADHKHDQAAGQKPAPKRFAETPKDTIDEKGALTASATAINTLVQQALPVEGGLLDESWAKVGDDARTIHKTGKGYFIVLVKNETGEESSLYLLLSDKGELYDANYTGSFEGLKE